MGMIVKHNLTAMNSNRMLGLTTSSQAKATEKLSSGYKINRAADDAAGLAISEKMRKQIRGLTQASLNAQDGISAVQTADGALNEVHDMMHRLAELTVKAANGTLSETDRQAVQNEVDELVAEVDRVSTTTKFNETYLMRGSNDGVSARLTYSVANTTLEDSFKAVSAQKKAPQAGGAPTAPSPLVSASSGQFTVEVKQGITISMTAPVTAPTKLQPGVNTEASEAANNTEYNGKTIGPVGKEEPYTYYVLVEETTAADPTKDKLSISQLVKNINDSSNKFNNPVGTVDNAGNKTASADATKSGEYNIKAFASMDELLKAMKADFGTDIKTITSFYNMDKATPALELKVETFADVNDPIDVSLHVGADSSADNKINMNISQLSARALGINGLDVRGDTGAAATAAIDVIGEALQRVSNQRAALGAIQNRLEHTIANLDNIVENTTSAEASIRDTDMATQMVEYSNNQILAQAGQAMLAQSNQATSGVLSLLQ
jgi:flagellin